MKRSPLLVVVLLVPIASWAQAPVEAPALEPPPEAVASITSREIEGHLRFLASDLLRGRGTGTADARLAAEYIASNLIAIGAEPMGDPIRGGKRSYLQRFRLEATSPEAEGSSLTLTITRGPGRRKIVCELGADYSYFPGNVAAGEIDAPTVFVGRGRVDADNNIDDYAGQLVKGCFVMAHRGDVPAQVRAAREKGAIGLVLLPPPDGGTSPIVSPEQLGFGRSRITLGPAPVEIPTLTLAAPIRQTLVEALNIPAPDASPPTAGADGAATDLWVNFKHAVRRETLEDHNVVGFLPGSDPEKAKEVIVFSAHFDHEGVNDKGEIFNGADDNASGSSGVLEIAQAFAAAPRPARSVLFLWVSAEEKGLLGSKWHADHQTLPAGHKLVANINLDMIGRNDPAKISATPSPKMPDHNTLVVQAAEATRAEGLEMLFDADQFYHRTDSHSFAAKGIPVIFFFAGIHEDYHKPTDDVDKIDFEKVARVARASFRLGWTAAQAPEPPRTVEAQP